MATARHCGGLHKMALLAAAVTNLFLHHYLITLLYLYRCEWGIFSTSSAVPLSNCGLQPQAAEVEAVASARSYDAGQLGAE